MELKQEDEEEAVEDEEEEDEDEAENKLRAGIEDNRVWNKYSCRVMYVRWLFEKREKAELEEEVTELRKERNALEREVAGLKKRLGNGGN